MEREGQPDPSEIADVGVESRESQPASPEESVEKVEKPLDGAQAEQMTVELQGELGNTANALLERAKQAGLAEDADVQGLLGEFAQLSEQLGAALEDFRAEAAKAEVGAAKIAAAHEAMPDIVGAEQVAKAQAGVEAAQAKVAQGEAARQTLQAEQARVEGVLEERVNEAEIHANGDGEKMNVPQSVDISSFGKKVVEQPVKDGLRAEHVKYLINDELSPRPFEGKVFQDNKLIESYRKEYVSLPDGSIGISANESTYEDGAVERMQMDYDNEGRVTRVGDVLDGETMQELLINYDERGGLSGVDMEGQFQGGKWHEHAEPLSDGKVRWVLTETSKDGVVTEHSGEDQQERYIARKKMQASTATRVGPGATSRRIDT